MAKPTSTTIGDILAEIRRDSRPRGVDKCKVATVLEALPDPYGPALKAAVDDPTISASAILRYFGTLRQQGILDTTVGEATLKNHRYGRCCCARA